MKEKQYHTRICVHNRKLHLKGRVQSLYKRRFEEGIGYFSFGNRKHEAITGL